MKILRLAAASGALIALLVAVSLAPDAPPPKRQITAIKCGKIYTVSDGVIARGVILIEDGRIVEVRKGDLVPDGAKVIDASNEVVIPGLVDGFTMLADYGDAEESVAPEVRASDGLDPFQDNWRILSGGVTTTYVAPGVQRLIAGQPAVAKTAGKSRVVRESWGLQITLGESVKNPPPIFKAPIPPSSDNPIRPAKRQSPVSRMGSFAELRRAFELLKTKDGLTDLQRKPLEEAAAGKRPVFIVVHTADDIVKAVLWAEETGVRPILVDAEESYKVADFLAQHKVPVILNGGVSPRRRYASDDARMAFEGERRFNAAATLSKAGVRVALRTPDDSDLAELLFIAGTAVRWGLSEEEALRSVTLTPAELLGVNDRVGSIAAGRDADLVFLGGDPFSAQALPQRVMVDGAIVFTRKDSDNRTYEASIADASRAKTKEILAIKCGRILTVTQGIIQDGLILIEDGKIVYVGRGRAIPKHAKIIDATADTVVPGMIDINSHLGFHFDQTEVTLRARRGVSSGNPSGNIVPASRLVRLDDPAYRDAASSGVTAIFLTPDGQGVCSIVKLSSGRATVVRENAGYMFTVQGGSGPYEQMKQQLERAKKYNDEWEAYEKSLKEGQQQPKPAPTEAPKPGDPVTGTWKGTMEIEQFQMKSDFTAELKLEGTKVSGTITTEMMGQSQTEAVDGTWLNNELRIEREEQGAKIVVLMKLVAPNHLKGDVTINAQGMTIKGTMECKRVAGGEGQASSTGGGAAAKKEPKKDEQLEPFRPLFRREIPAVVRARDLPGVENAVRLFRDDYNLEYFIVGADQTVYMGELLFAKGAGAAFGPEFMVERRGARVNVAEALASSGVPVAFYSDATTGTKLLPLTAAYAVRHGMDPFDALKAVTINPARMLRADARLGSIERGRDADLVILTGHPFDLNTRVKYVIVDGKVVHQEK